MPPFPYFEIVKKAYELTVKHSWLWVFGLFIGGTTGLNFGVFNYFLPAYQAEQLSRLREIGTNFLPRLLAREELLIPVLAGVLFLALFLVLLSGLSKAAVIWATAKLDAPGAANSPPGEVNFRKSLRSGRRYLWQIVGLQVLVSAVFLLLFLVFAGPVAYLFSAGASGKGLVLLLLGLLIFLPASVVFGFLHLYGPIFIVLYNSRIGEAIQYSFNLLRQKLKESLLLGAFLLGLSLLFVFVLIFSLVVLAIPVAFLTVVLVKLQLLTAIFTLLLGTAAVSICYTVILGAAFAVFQNIIWVLAVSYLVKTKRLGQEERALAAEPVV